MYIHTLPHQTIKRASEESDLKRVNWYNSFKISLWMQLPLSHPFDTFLRSLVLFPCSNFDLFTAVGMRVGSRLLTLPVKWYGFSCFDHTSFEFLLFSDLLKLMLRTAPDLRALIFLLLAILLRSADAVYTYMSTYNNSAANLSHAPAAGVHFAFQYFLLSLSISLIHNHILIPIDIWQKMPS